MADRDRAGDAVGLRIDTGDRSVAGVCCPDRPGPHGDCIWKAPDGDCLHHGARARIDAGY